MGGQPFDLHAPGGKIAQTERKRAERRGELRAHKICERQARVRRAGEDGSPPRKPRQLFAGEIVDGEQPAAVGVALCAGGGEREAAVHHAGDPDRARR